LICANSPQAKGRIERLFSTLQDRLVKELRLRKINSIEKANKYLPEYIEMHNEKFAIEPKDANDLHKTISEEKVRKTFRYKEERILSKNLELSYCNRILQIKSDKPTYAMKKARVTVVESLDGNIEIMYKGEALQYKELLVKDHQGKILNKKEVMARVFPLGGKNIIYF